MTQRKGETGAEYLKRVAGWLDMEDYGIVNELPTAQACIEYFELWSVYDTDLMEGIIEAIESEGADATAYNKFVDKWKLGWSKFKKGEWV